MALNSNCTFVINPPKPEHSHDAPSQKVEETQFPENVLQSVEINPTKKLKDIYDEKLQGSTSDYIPIYNTIRPSMSKLRTKILPQFQVLSET